MTTRRYILRDDSVLTPQAVRAILAKELLIKGSRPAPSSSNLITSSGYAYAIMYACQPSDSAVQDLDEDSALLTMLASEDSLRRAWDTPEEDEAWADLLKGML